MVLWCHQTFSHCIKSLHSLICNAYQNDLKFYFWWKNDQFLVFCNSVSSMWHAKARMCKLISYSHVLQCFTSYNSILLFEFYDDICKSIFAVHHCRWPSGIPGLRVHTDLDIHRIDQTRGRMKVPCVWTFMKPMSEWWMSSLRAIKPMKQFLFHQVPCNMMTLP